MNNQSIPKDPIMLVSFLNMKLRDFYPSLDALCDDLSLNVDEIKQTMASINYQYNEQANRFL